MKALRSFPPRVALAVGLLAVTVGAIGLLALREAAARPPPIEILLPTPTTAPAVVVVHLAGQVGRPGVYTFPAGTRLYEGIDAAGGAGPDADLDALNQAMVLQDGQRYFVPRRAETAGATASSTRGPVDLNLASTVELEALDGIGPELARRIVAYRQQNGPYRSVEDLMAVQGIGPSLLDRLRPQVAVQ